MTRLLLSIAWIALFPLALWAQVQGEDDPRYQKLRTEWLAGSQHTGKNSCYRIFCRRPLPGNLWRFF